MIKRTYFLHTRTRLVSGEYTGSYSLFTRTSWLPQHKDALQYERQIIATRLGVAVDDVIPETFNRC